MVMTEQGCPETTFLFPFGVEHMLRVGRKTQYRLLQRPLAAALGCAYSVWPGPTEERTA